MKALINRAGVELIRRRFNSVDDLCRAMNASLVEHLMRTGSIQIHPFDEQACIEASFEDIDQDSVRRFVRQSRQRRNFPLPETADVQDVLAHLNFVRDGHPTNAAVLLFARNPLRFISCAEVRCMHFHGTAVQRPAPYYRVFKGTLFEMLDEAVDFILSRLDRSVGTREKSVQAPVRFEVPPDVVAEAVVNAIAHRDYASSEAIQISVFMDRVEISNPGGLLPPLTIEKLHKPHRSVTRNSRICEALYVYGSIEKFGTGTLMMIQESVEHDLPEPDFSAEAGEFSVVLWRDWLTERVLGGLNLNPRQDKVIPHLKIRREITNAEYRSITGTIQRTALRDLDEMVQKGLLVKSAGRGRSTAYRLSPNPDTHRTIRTFRKPDITRTNRTLPKPAKDVPQPKPAMRRATVSRQGKTNTKKK